jgi:NTE family protein
VAPATAYLRLELTAPIRVPEVGIYAVDLSFAALKDTAELDLLNRQPTSFLLPAEAVDLLRAAACTIFASRPTSSGC